MIVIYVLNILVLIPKYGLEGTLYLDTGDIKSVYDEEVRVQLKKLSVLRISYGTVTNQEHVLISDGFLQ